MYRRKDALNEEDGEHAQLSTLQATSRRTSPSISAIHDDRRASPTNRNRNRKPEVVATTTECAKIDDDDDDDD